MGVGTSGVKRTYGREAFPMRVSDSHRVVFVHVPKTGGSSVDRIFDDEVDDARRVAHRTRHSTYRALLKTEPGLADYWSFGFVRNPWARMVSWWSMLSGVFARAAAGDVAVQQKIARHPNVWLAEGEYHEDFSRFVLEATEAIPKVGRPQLTTLSGKNGPVDFIGRLESFDDDIAVVRERLGLPAVEKVPRVNRSTHGDYRDYYDDVTRQKVAEVYAADIEAFGYTF
jgi:hypothetical protein